MSKTGASKPGKSLKGLLRFGVRLFRACRAAGWTRFSLLYDYLHDLSYWQKRASADWQPRLADLMPMLAERLASAGSARGHYFLQDIWAARHVLQLNPEVHVDVGSRVDGFVAHVACSLPVEYVDLRPLETGIANIRNRQGNICELPYPDNSVESLSCLHVLEHIGLGRYGDPLDVDGWKKGLSELARTLKPGGQLLLSVPVGRQRVCFNAHRIFLPQTIIEKLPELQLLEFSLIKDDNATEWVTDADLSDTGNLDYGCGLFRFAKRDKPHERVL